MSKGKFNHLFAKTAVASLDMDLQQGHLKNKKLKVIYKAGRWISLLYDIDKPCAAEYFKLKKMSTLPSMFAAAGFHTSLTVFVKKVLKDFQAGKNIGELKLYIDQHLKQLK